jgi:TRAP-type C4-dicarboxylate transport system substrate-binding protein
MQHMRLFGLVAAMVVAQLFTTAPLRASADPIVMKIGTATLNDTQHEWMKRYKAAVERDSKGRIEVQLYPASQLGSIPREIEGTQFGAIQGWVGPPEFLNGVDERFQVLSAPAVFTSLAQAQRTSQDPAFNKAFMALGADKGLVGGAVWISGTNALMMRKPVRHLADVKNLKIRILAGPLQEGVMRVMGATGIPMPLDQVAPALQQGAIDGIITNVSTGAPLKYFESAPYATEINQPYIFSICVLSKTWYEKLAPDLQKIVSDDASKVGRDILPFVNTFLKEQRAAWTAGGGELISLPPNEEAQLITSFAPIAADVMKDKPAMLSMYNAMLAARARAK